MSGLQRKLDKHKNNAKEERMTHTCSVNSAVRVILYLSHSLRSNLFCFSSSFVPQTTIGAVGPFGEDDNNADEGDEEDGEGEGDGECLRSGFTSTPDIKEFSSLLNSRTLAELSLSSLVSKSLLKRCRLLGRSEEVLSFGVSKRTFRRGSGWESKREITSVS
jgi:hypothetical protein